MITPKLVLTIVAGGTLMGLAGQATLPTSMKPPPEQPWRHMLEPKPVTATGVSYRFADTGPTDLSPHRDRRSWHRRVPSVDVYYDEPAQAEYAPPTIPEYRSATLPEPVGNEVAFLPAEPTPAAGPKVIDVPRALAEKADRAANAAAEARDAALEVAQAMELPRVRGSLAGM